MAPFFSVSYNFALCIYIGKDLFQCNRTKNGERGGEKHFLGPIQEMAA
jgi:hypothetical protein